MSAVEQVAAIVTEHAYDYPDSFCGCGAFVGTSPWVAWPRHVAMTLAAANLLADPTP
jgi:hypothetical protein